jgi:hypothetical protein
MIRKEHQSGSLGAGQKFQNKSNPFLSDAGFYDIQGFHYDEVDSIKKWDGLTKYNIVVNNDNVFTGIFDYPLSNGTRQHIATGLTGIYRYGFPNTLGWNPISLSNCGGSRTGTKTDLYDFCVLNDQLYLFNGVDTDIRYDGTTAYNRSIVAPTVTATETHSSGTGLSATYGFQYLYTYYNNSLGNESNPNPTLSTSTGVFTNKAVTLTVKCSADPQVNKINIYRTTDGGGLPLYCGQVANIVGTGTTTFVDTFSDASLGIAIDYTGNGVAPTSMLAKIYKGVLVTVPKNSSRIWFSKPNKPGAVDPDDFRDLDPNDGSYITGLKRMLSMIVAFKGNSIWNGSGDDRSTFTFTRSVSDIGCIASKSIVTIPGASGASNSPIPIAGNTVMFLSGSGWYQYNGVSVQYKSFPIEKTFKKLNKSRLSQTVGVVYQKLNTLAWIVPSGSNTENDLMVTYDYVQDKWGTRSLKNTTCNVVSILQDDNGEQSLYGGGYNGFVWKMDDGMSDDGYPIDCFVIDRAHPKLPPGIISEQKKGFYCLFVWFKQQLGTLLTVSYCVDNPDGIYKVIDTVDCGHPSGMHHIRFNAIGRRIYFKFSNSQKGQPLTIRGWMVEYKVLGRHADNV